MAPRTGLVIALVASASSVALVGCLQDFDSFLPTGAGGSGGGTTSSSVVSSSSGNMSSSSSLMPDCTPQDVSMCTPATNDCEQAICTAAGECAIGPKAAKAPCMTAGPQQDGPGVCNGSSVCLGCIDVSDCPLDGMGNPQLCPMSGPNANTCVPAGCTNGRLDGMETDTDCGGPACPGCVVGEDCLVNGDCQTGSCNGGTNLCQECGANGDCETANYCDTAAMPLKICKAKEVQGTACTLGDGQCDTDHCVNGFCCDTACTDGCNRCDAANTDAANGTCAPISVGLDPDNECPAGSTGCLTGSCDGAGACGIRPSTANCGMGPACVGSAPTAIFSPQDKCSGTGDTCNASTNITCANGYTCTGGACNTTCTLDSQCVSNNCENTMNSPKQGDCVVCNGTGDCGGGLQCEEAFNMFEDTCVQCRQSVAAFPAVNSDCSASTAGRACLTATDTCGCTAAQEMTACTGLPPRCATSGVNISRCVDCDVGNATHCSSNTDGKLCLDGAGGTTINTCGCKAASEGTDCAGIAGKPRCAVTGVNAFTCQECNVGSATHCTSNTKGALCLDGSGGTTINTCGCRAATEVSDCASTTGKQCVTSGANQFTCQECDGDGDCMDESAGHGSDCSPTGGTANTCGCTVANQVADCTSGMCNGMTHVCM